MRVFFALLAAILAATSCSARTLSDEEISTFGGCYFAPMCSSHAWRMRDQDGAIHEFELDSRGPGRLAGALGWTGKLTQDGVRIHAPENSEYPTLDYHFKQGRLATLLVDGRECNFSYPNPLVYEGEVIEPLWPTGETITKEEYAAQTTMWKEAGRLRLWFASPNQAGIFCAFVGFILLAGLLRIRRVRWRIPLSALFLAALALVALTGSRGAVLASAVGVMVMLVCHGHATGWLTPRRLLVALGIVILLVGVSVSVAYARGRSHKGNRASDRQRLEVFSLAPAMMHDAPSGWGEWSRVGRAYSDWYQPLADSRVRFNLISDHLTSLVALGRWKGFLYLFAWLAGIFLLVRYAWMGGPTCPAAVWLALAIASSLNVIFFAPHIPDIPVLTLVVLLVDRRWLRPRCWLPAVTAGLVAAAVVLGVLIGVGDSYRSASPVIAHASNRTIVNGVRTTRWLVADEDVLGLSNMPRELRAFYAQVPHASALGVVTGLEDLPEEPIHCLILSGEWGLSFLETFKRNSLPIKLPQEIVFLAPDFAPSEIPASLKARAKVKYVIGEFAARYFSDCASPPRWVTVVPGSEIYMPGWPQYCFL